MRRPAPTEWATVLRAHGRAGIRHRGYLTTFAARMPCPGLWIYDSAREAASRLFGEGAVVHDGLTDPSKRA